MNRVFIAGAVAASLLLTGCVTHSSPPPSGLSGAEKARYLEVLSGSIGGSESVEFVPSAGWGTVIAGCMNAAGYSEYEGSGPSIRNVSVDVDGDVSFTASISGDLDQLEQLTVCLTQYPVLPDLSGNVNLAQLDYLYDYFRDFLIPCLSTTGHPVRGEIPTRAEYVVITGEQHWHPYDSLPATAFRDGTIYDQCPASPFVEDVRF